MRFAALKNRDCRNYLYGGALAMMADNVEHVITYLVLWKWFNSPSLVAFQVLSHWTPFLLGSVYAGALADRFDCRRIIQLAQIMYMACSAVWGVMFLAGFRSLPLACVILVIHGVAGAIWMPAEQLMLHDFVNRTDLESAVRLNATFRSIGILCGPVAGGALLAIFGASDGLGTGTGYGMFANIIFYLPLTLFLMRTKFTGHLHDSGETRERMTFRSAGRVLQYTWRDPALMAMVVLGGLGSFFIGAVLQSVMPSFAEILGTGDTGFTYEVLLLATGAGGVVGGLLLEVVRVIRPTVAGAIVATFCYGAATAFFALTGSYLLAVILLFISGVANLANMSISQTVVQLMAPTEIRGQVIGVYGMSAAGLRIGSAFTVGFIAEFIGIPYALAASSAALCAGTLILAGVIARGKRQRGGELLAPGAVGS